MARAASAGCVRTRCSRRVSGASFLLGSGEPCPEIGPAERHYSNGCTGGRDVAPVFGLVAGFKEPPSGLVTEPFCGRGGIGLPEMPGRGYVGGLLGAGGPPADSGSVADGSCRCAEEFVVVDKVAAIIVAASRGMILFFTCISLEASLKGGAFSQSLLALGESSAHKPVSGQSLADIMVTRWHISHVTASEWTPCGSRKSYPAGFAR